VEHKNARRDVLAKAFEDEDLEVRQVAAERLGSRY
jgi:hypothetical protein